MRKNPNKKTIIREKREKETVELDRIAKMLVRRDLQLAEIREKREKEFEELRESRKALMDMLKDVEESRVALMNILEDVEGARKNAEEEKNKTTAIIANFVDGLLVFDQEDKLALINSQAEHFFNLRSSQLLGKSISELASFVILKPLTSLIGKELKQISKKELNIRETLIIEVTTLPLVMDKKKIGSLVILHDITREKTIEKLKTEFVSIAAHQLRTPLSAIKWTLRLILDGDVGKISKEQTALLEKGYQSNERMITLVNDLLNVARIEEGRFLYSFSSQSLESLFEKVIDGLAKSIQEKKIKLTFEKPKKPLPKIKIDQEKMEVVIQNLLDNAIRYNSAGGRVTISIKHNKMNIEVMVKDTGMGIPEYQQARLFTKFFRGDNAVKAEAEGTGLGLFITKNIIEEHNGKIWFESEEGKGATFWFTLPVK